MAGERVTWDDATQGSTIAGLEQQILEMKSAKNRMLPEIDILKPNWKTEGSKATIVALEQFLTNDFEEFVKMFDIAVGKLQGVRVLSQEMNQIK